MRAAPVALTCGDPAGIGLDIAAQLPAFGDALPDHFILADRHHVATRCRCVAVEIKAASEARQARRHGLPFIHVEFAAPAQAGQPEPANAEAILTAIRMAVAMTRRGEACALCTGPVNKAQLMQHAGFRFPGQTEFLAALCDIAHVAMMLASPALRVVPATIHTPLRSVPDLLDPACIARTITLTHRALIEDFAVARPRLAITGLNPHAGENGHLGDEELRIIAPASAQARANGITIDGPLSADAVFREDQRGAYDAIICMYHDQALIPVKAIAGSEAVNCTLGLPIVRTSPGHGTAYTLAGQAPSADSLACAVTLARTIADHRHHGRPINTAIDS